MHTATLPISKRYKGPLILKEALRPFFLAANLWAVSCMLIWIAILSRVMPAPDTMAAVDWHQHELLFGYTSAVIAGFLLTVVSNWTGRKPISGQFLLLLVIVWGIGRLAMYSHFSLSPQIVAVADLAFPVAVVVIVARELVLGGNYRNLAVLVMLFLFIGANILFHLDIINGIRPVTGIRLGISAVLLLIMVMGGRVIPAFTRNWLLLSESKILPRAFNHFDTVSLLLAALVLIIWAFAGESLLIGWAMLCVGLLHFIRLARWCGHKTFTNPILLIMHQAYALIPVGFLAMGAAQLWTLHISISAAIHLWTTGALSVTCMAMMTRAGLGHTEQQLKANSTIISVYVMLLSAVFLRFYASVSPHYILLIQASALLWCLAHFGFLVRYTTPFFVAR